MNYSMISRLESDRGSAMVVSIMVMAVLTGLGAVVFTVGFNNLRNAGSDRLSEGAQGASEAGVAQAISFIRSEGVGSLTCRPSNPSTCNNVWGMNNPKSVTVTVTGGNQRIYKTWVEQIQQFSPSLGFKTGTYMIHSEGTTVPRPGKRTVQVRISVKPIEFPIGLFGNSFSDPGTAQVLYESMFSIDCIQKRQLITFSGSEDQYHHLPPAAYSTKWITTSLVLCSASDPNNIHAPKPPLTNPGSCNTSYLYDRDRLGAAPPDAPCAALISSNYIDDAEDLRQFGYDPSKPKGLSDAEYRALKSKAQEQGYYATSINKCNVGQTPPSCWKAPDPSQHPNAVMYFDLFGVTGSDTLVVQGSDITGYEGLAPATTKYCGSRSLIIVVRDGNLTLSGGVNIIAALFVPDASPDGTYKGAASAKVLGTLFANNIDLTGNHTFTLRGESPNDPDCFFQNLPGGLIDVVPTNFHEKDR